MDENQPKVGSFSWKYGLILGLIGVVFALMLFFMDAHTERNTAVTIINIALIVVIIFWGITSFRKANEGFLSLGQGVKLGTGIALVGGIVAVVYTMILANVLDPEFTTKVAEIQKAADEAAGKSVQEIQQRYDGTINFFWISYPFILILNVILGLVTGLIGGLIFKKAKPDY